MASPGVAGVAVSLVPTLAALAQPGGLTGGAGGGAAGGGMRGVDSGRTVVTPMGEIPLVAHLGGVTLGAVVVVFGVWVLLRARLKGRVAGPVGFLKGWRDPSVLVLGICVILLGYHGVAYVSPAAWFPLSVPIQRWWLLVLGCGVAMTLARAADRLEDLQDGDQDGDAPDPPRP